LSYRNDYSSLSVSMKLFEVTKSDSTNLYCISTGNGKIVVEHKMARLRR
jgi:hypothetical protein